MKLSKVAAVILVVSLLLALAAWWFLPQPPAPWGLYVVVGHIALFLMPHSADGSEELMYFLVYWVYLLAASLAVTYAAVLVRSRRSKGVHAQL